MTEDSCPKVSGESNNTTTSAAPAKQRKKRKWDQPAESFISAGLAVPGVLPFANVGSLVSLPTTGTGLFSGALFTNTVPATTISQVSMVPALQQNVAAVVQKLNQPKIQDELIAREIIINDAEATIRYKLTKRQTQEEIQKSSGAVVITRGKYRPPNSVPDNEKPLYLHISAGAHLKETAERIKAVDRAAAIIEELLKQGSISHLSSASLHSATNVGGQVSQLNVIVYLGFDSDPSLNIAARIRGPNDQYINHIMNETGATVILRGRGSGNVETPNGEESQQALHLYLSSNNKMSLESAKLLAENLMDTIAAECGASRVLQSKGYNAVPPPQQLLDGVQSSGIEQRVNFGSAASLGSPGMPSAFPPTTIPQPGGMLSCGQPQQSTVFYPQHSVGTSYSGYGGIYPQATPLQQVALALRQSPSPVNSVVGPATSAGTTLSKANSKTETEKRSHQKRKFQELPAASKGTENPNQKSLQASECYKPSLPSEGCSSRNISTMPPPKKLVQPSSNGMPPPPPRMLPSPSGMLPPPPPKFVSSTPLSKVKGDNSVLVKSTSEAVPDTLIKLLEYGEDDDDPEGTDDELPRSTSKSTGIPKPFWAL